MVNGLDDSNSSTFPASGSLAPRKNEKRPNKWTLWVSITVFILAALMSVLSLVNLHYTRQDMRIEIDKIRSNK